MQLGTYLGRAAVNRLVTTPRYWALLAPGFLDPLTLSQMVQWELAARMSDLLQEESALKRELGLWTNQPGLGPGGAKHAIVLDTNVLLAHANHLDQVDWARRADHRDGDIALVVPSMVVDELDDLKMSDNRMKINNDFFQTRDLARRALRELDQLFCDGFRIATIGELGAGRRLHAILQVDELNTARLSRADSEILRQAQNTEAFARSVTVASYDHNILFTARNLRLRTIPFRYTDLEPAALDDVAAVSKSGKARN
jgi:uncharacterized protein YqcC (DUF446 family)